MITNILRERWAEYSSVCKKVDKVIKIPNLDLETQQMVTKKKIDKLGMGKLFRC